MTIPKSQIAAFYSALVSENKSHISINEHIRYANRFADFVGGRKLCEPLLNEYRQHINAKYTTHNSKNSCVSYVNTLLKFLGKDDLVIAYFESNRTTLKIKTAPLTDDDISILLSYAEKCE